MENLSLSPIGIIRTQMRMKFDAPHQPSGHKKQINTIELFPGHNFEQGLLDLDGFSVIWILWWFHLNNNWRPLVRPPRGINKKRGVFATRSPHRPNPIGITAVPLLGINGRSIYVGECDLLDQTPILDIKPYLSAVDCFPEAKKGWTADLEAPLEATYRVTVSKLAQKQLDWLKEEHSIDFISRATEILAVNPQVHRTRRISRSGNGFKMGCGAWKLFFTLSGNDVCIEKVFSGYPERTLKNQEYDYLPDRAAQIAFRELWSE